MKHAILKSFKIFLLYLCLFEKLFAQVWNIDADGAWNTASHWNPEIVSNDFKAIVTFGHVSSAPRTITIQGTSSMGALNFDNIHAYELLGGTLKLNGPINVTNENGNGAHIIGSNLFLQSDCIITQNSTENFTISGGVSGTGALIKSGGGTLILSGTNTHTGGTILKRGILCVGANANNLGNGSLIFNGGALNVNGSFLTSNTASLYDAGVIDVDENKFLLLTGNVDGKAALVKSGKGMLVLSGANTYLGGTNIELGTLSVNAESALGVGNIVFNGGELKTSNSFTSNKSIVLNNTAIFDTDESTTLTLAGPINGPQGLIKKGNGTLILSGENMYVGVTEIHAGTLEGTTTSLKGNITNNSSLIFNQSTDGTYIGTISGPGSLIKSGEGNLIFTGANTYSGGTVISVGALEGTTNNLQGNITNNSALIFNQFTNGTYSGVISGSGSLTKSGPGNVIFTNLHTHTGETTVLDGTLTVNGALNTSIITVHANGCINGSGVMGPTTVDGGTVRGNGTYNSLTINSGNIRVGDSIGTINILGNYIQGSDVIYEVEIDESVSDRIIATGSATIDNGAILTIPPPTGNVIEGTTYDILTATGGINQLWSTVNFPEGLNLDLQLVNEGTIAQLTLLNRILFFGKSIDSNNPSNVAEYLRSLDASNPILPPDLSNVLTVMDSLNSEDLNQALNQLHPALFGAFELANLDNNALIASTFSEQLAHFPCDKRECFAKEDKKSPTPKNSFWISPFGNFTDVDKYQQLRGFDTKSGGFVLGYDRCFPKAFLLGIGSGYTYTDLYWKNSSGNATIHKVFGALYGGYSCRHLTIDTSVFGGANFYDVLRKINFSNISRAATNTHTGNFATAHLGTDITFYPKRDLLQILALVDYFYLHQPKYTETGAGSLNLEIDQKNSHLLRSELGGKYTLRRNCIHVFFALSWVRKTPLGSDTYSSQLSDFTDAPCELIVQTFDTSKDFISPEAGIFYTLGNFMFSIGYKGEFANDYHVNQAKAKLQGIF